MTPLPARAPVSRPPTVPPGVTPPLDSGAGGAGSGYAPNLQVDRFRHRGLYYYRVAGRGLMGHHPPPAPESRRPEYPRLSASLPRPF